ncbi:MAG TPA: hypothetical protein VLL52_06570, partial [Anaerolineae bacterium]|nr:hypothetical protein [Anaerolineae bacterium]
MNTPNDHHQDDLDETHYNRPSAGPNFLGAPPDFKRRLRQDLLNQHPQRQSAWSFWSLFIGRRLVYNITIITILAFATMLFLQYVPGRPFQSEKGLPPALFPSSSFLSYRTNDNQAAIQTRVAENEMISTVNYFPTQAYVTPAITTPDLA